jgi:hypothetical protein
MKERRLQRVKHWLAVLLALALALGCTQTVCAAESLDQTVNYLIAYIGKADAVFIRNGATHTPAEAADHIRAKYEHFKPDIKTPEDFIRLAASKSLLTGTPYMVRPKGGKEEPMSEWLTQVLKAHRAAAGPR